MEELQGTGKYRSCNGGSAERTWVKQKKEEVTWGMLSASSLAVGSTWDYSLCG